MARRKSGQQPVYGVLVPQLPFRYHPHDYHPDYVIQRLPETAYHLLLHSDGCGRRGSSDAAYRKDIQFRGNS